jgi:hypothetical protein
MDANSSPQNMTRGNFVLLIDDTLRLLLPQHEVGAVEFLESIPVARDNSCLLTLSDDEGARRYAVVSKQMTLLAHCPVDRFLVVTLGDDNDNLGWCWNELQILVDVELQFHPLPRVLLTPDAPVDHYVEIGGELAFLCSAYQLHQFVFSSIS